MDERARWWIDEVLAKSPVAKTLGIEVVSAEAERVVLGLPFDPANTTVGDTVHGGVIATLVDVAGASASASGITGDDATGGATSQMSLSYLASADGCDLVAEATVVHRTRTQTLTDVLVRDDQDRLVAKGTVTSRIFRG